MVRYRTSGSRNGVPSFDAAQTVQPPQDRSSASLTLGSRHFTILIGPESGFIYPRLGLNPHSYICLQLCLDLFQIELNSLYSELENGSVRLLSFTPSRHSRSLLASDASLALVAVASSGIQTIQTRGVDGGGKSKRERSHDQARHFCRTYARLRRPGRGARRQADPAHPQGRSQAS
ncbi:hypothetical protein FQZ97_837300 [compost metagenome]